MSPGAIAETAILVAGFDGFAFIVAASFLIFTKRICFAATPKPQQQKAEGGQP